MLPIGKKSPPDNSAEIIAASVRRRSGEGFTHAPESHRCKFVVFWLSVRGFALRQNSETTVKPWGFTLLELILVAVIISVFIGLSSPLFRRTFSDLELRNTSFNIARIISYAREMAIIEKTNYKVNFNLKQGKFWITRLDYSKEIPEYKRVSGRNGRIFSLPRGFSFSGKSDEVIFYPDGRSQKFEIKVINPAKEGRLIRVKGFGVDVEIKDLKDVRKS